MTFLKKHWVVILGVLIAGVLFMNYMNDKYLAVSGYGYATESESSVGASSDGYGGGYNERTTSSKAAIGAPLLLASPSANYNVSESYDSNSYDSAETDTYPVPPEDGSSDEGVEASDRMIIRSGSMIIEVDAPEETFEEMKKYVDSVGGFVEAASVNDTNDTPTPYYEQTKSEAAEKPHKEVSASIRVPEDKLDATLTTFRSYGYVKNESVSGTDVTASYRDNAAQLENLKAREVKVREFYNKAKDVTETLQVFQELEQIRSQIENIERQQQTFERQANFSTIYISLTPKVSDEPFVNDEWNVKKVWTQSVNTLKLVLRDLTELGIKLLVYAVIWVPLLIIALIVRKVVRKKRAALKDAAFKKE